MIDWLPVVYIVLIVAMGATTFAQKTNDMMFAAYVFTGSILMFDFVSHFVEMDTFYYYITAGLIDVLVLNILVRLVNPCRLAYDLAIISFISIGYNFVGFIMLYQGLEDTVYRFMYFVLYGWAFYVLTRGEPKHDRDAKDDK
jgi:hypothetical protein